MKNKAYRTFAAILSLVLIISFVPLTGAVYANEADGAQSLSGNPGGDSSFFEGSAGDPAGGGALTDADAVLTGETGSGSDTTLSDPTDNPGDPGAVSPGQEGVTENDPAAGPNVDINAQDTLTDALMADPSPDAIDGIDGTNYPPVAASGFMLLMGALDPPWTDANPPTVADGDVVTISDKPQGTLDVPTGATVTVEGTVTGAETGITLNIGAGATVIWNADFQGVAKTYFVTVTGGGNLDISSSSIVNIGPGGALDIEGAGTTVTLGSGANIYSGVGGSGILVSADNVSVDVNSGSSVQSLSGNGNAAIQIGSGSNNNILNTVININGGSVASIGGGYAINDGAGTGTVSNNTQITVNSGSITAETACAIHSTGTGSAVTLNGGTVSNAAGNNANPAIYMNAGSGDNVTVNGGTVQSTSAAGYAIQTTGNVSVTGGQITAVNGRCINLVGMNSLATVSGGMVQTTGSGIAISTATTAAVIPEVANASILVTGGTVSSANGSALNTTGAHSDITISGGQIISNSATTGNNAVNASGDYSTISVTGGTITAVASHGINVSGAHSAVTVSGGTVSSYSGNAINGTTAASDATITVGGTAKAYSILNHGIQTASSRTVITIDDNCQIWAMRNGDAIHTMAGTQVTLNGGFVFAFWPYSLKVINATNISVPADSTTVVVGWNHDLTGPPIHDVRIYNQYENLADTDTDLIAGADLTLNIAPGDKVPGDNTNIGWYNDPTQGGGIYYSNGANTGFFPLADVTVIQDYGLIFNATDGLMYANNDGTGVPGGANILINPLPGAWSASLGSDLLYDLTMDGFSWNTSAPAALTIYGGPTTITLANGSVNDFASFGPDTTGISGEYTYDGTFGIYSNYAITVQGSGTLITTGGDTTDGDSVGIQADSFTLSGGSLVATGGTSNSASYGVNIENANDLTITGGTFVSMGKSGALGGNLSTLAVSQILPPTAYTWWTNSTAAPPSPMGNGTVAFTGSPSYGTPLNYTDAYKYVKIIGPPFAVVGNVTVSGTEGVALAEQTATITLFGGTFAAGFSGDVSSWFAELPEGVTVTAGPVSSDGQSLTLTFSGTPTAPSSAVFDITIPGSALDGGASSAAYPVYPNPNALFDIAAVYDLIVVAESGGTVDGTLSGRYLAGSPVETTATANPGYRFTGWKISVTTLRNASANTASFYMPAGSVTLTAKFVKIQKTPAAGGSGSSGSGSSQTAVNASPQTGDYSNPQIWTLALLIAAIGMSCLIKLILIRKNARRQQLLICGHDPGFPNT